MRALRRFEAGLVILVMSVAANPTAGLGQEEDRAEAGLRGVFLDDGPGTREDPAGGRVVGRLALQLVTDDSPRQVKADHVFRSGDRFRFEITPSRDGWLYLLHRTPGGEEQVLWPPDEVSSQVWERTTYVVPPSPRAFRFDEEVGEETFYVVVRAAPPSGAQEKDAEVRKRIQYLVRNLDEDKPKGVRFDPGPRDGDLHVYFAAADGDDGSVAVMELRLRHE